MGQIFHNLTQPGTALQDPGTGQTTAIGNPNQILGATQPALQSAFTPDMSGVLSGTPKPQQIGPLPSIGKPSFSEAASAGALPGSGNPLSPGLNKAGKLAVLLTSGLQGALAGHAAQEQAILERGVRRAGGAGLAFQQAYMLPWQRAMAPLQYQQAEAQTQLARAGAQPVQTPFGEMPAEFASRSLLPWMVRGQAMQNVAQTNAGAKIQTQQIANQGRMDVAQMQAMIAANRGAKYVPDFDPQTKQPFYHVFNLYGKELGRADVNMIPALMSRTSSTVDFQQDANGNFVALPKTTVSSPVLPGGQSPVAAAPKGARPVNNARPVSAPGGGPLQGANSTKWATWTDPQTNEMVAGAVGQAPKGSNPAVISGMEVQNIINARHALQLMTKQGDPKDVSTWGELQLIDSLAKDGKLGTFASRYNRLVTQGIGTSPGDDPRIITLIDKNMLGQTATMLSHFGASGGRSPEQLQHFMDMANAGKMDAQTLRSGVRAIADYMKDRSLMPSASQPSPNRPKNVPSNYNFNPQSRHWEPPQ